MMSEATDRGGRRWTREELHEERLGGTTGELIVEAALRAGAVELASEDLQNGRRFGHLKVHNPFSTE